MASARDMERPADTDRAAAATRSIGTVLGVVFALSLVACLAFVGVAAQELQYANAHPYAYGPAKVIALAAAAGALLSAAVAMFARALMKAPR